MKAFLEVIAERLLNKFPDSMENIAVVLPSKRSVVFLKSYLSKRIDKPIFLPQFFSIEEFIESLSGFKVLDNLSLQFYLYQSYLKNPPSEIDSFESFMNWSSMLLHDFNEVDRNLVDAKLIFSNLKNVKELENWNLEDWSFSDNNLTKSQEDYIHFYNNMYQWYTQFNLILSNKNRAYQGMAYRKAASDIQDKELVWDKVWFVGLNALTKSEQQIVDCLKKKNIARVFWDADQYYYDNINHEAGDFLRTQRDKWKEIDFKGVGNYFSLEKDSFNVIACPKNISQARVTSDILSQFSESDLSESNTAIVLADEGLLYPVLNHLPQNVKDINVTMGSPLKNTPFYSFLNNIFEMQLYCSSNQEGFYFKDVLKVINHPLFLQFTSTERVVKLRCLISEKNKVIVSTDVMSLCLKDDFRKVEGMFSSWKGSLEAISLVECLIIFFRERLIGKKNSIESEVLFAFNTSFQLIKNLLSESDFLVEVKTLYTILKQLLSKEVVPFQGEPLKGIQLMGILESRTLDFKNIILLSVNEGLLPKGKTLNSFIPYDLKVHFKMPTYRESDAVFSYHFYRLLQRSQNVNILYNTETDDFGSGEKSRFITQLLSEYPYPINKFVYGGEELSFCKDKEIRVENNGVEKQIEEWSSYVSPSALSTYNNCSLSFYYKYLSKIKPSDEVSEFAEANIMGTAVHNAFDKVYPKGIVLPNEIKLITNKLLDKVEEEFITLMKGEDVSQGKNYLSLQISKKLALNFLQYEQGYLQKAITEGKRLNILESEGIFDNSIQIRGKTFTIKGKVDRVDEFENKLRIIDYKTGKVSKNDVSISDWEELSDGPKKGKAFQLLVYAYLYLKNKPQYLDKEVIAGNFSFKNLKEDLITVAKTVGRKKETILVDNHVLQDTEEIISEILTKIMTEDFAQTENISRCEYCDYKPLCNR